ncbi:hypothetical protein Tsubulata_043740 [Turnera subulata]|uniref:DUF4283 domain-containing protein n=1 Tax=Turnera subulata TaxID=218843 RepID=A0A9Q0FFF7_9ROSI|nr:hypothetical protein Tsubulata_043740 [Turnera subulata]
MAPSSLYDAVGTVREKPSLVMDLGKLVLPNPNSSSFQKMKGKSVTSVQQPITFAPTMDDSLAPQPQIGFIHAIINKLWGRDGIISVSHYKDGLFLFQFPTEDAYNRAVSRGPWHVGGIPFMLWPWTSSSKKMDFSNAVFPVWIKLKHVPLELLTTEGLSSLASALVDFSKPLLNELKLDINGLRKKWISKLAPKTTTIVFTNTDIAPSINDLVIVEDLLMEPPVSHVIAKPEMNVPQASIIPCTSAHHSSREAHFHQLQMNRYL